MKILKIQIHNFLGLAAFKSDRLGKLNRITGDNGVGKSSVLKAIKEAFKSSGVDPELIRLDSDKAEIIVELDDKVLLERHLTAGSNTVKVTVDGQPMTSPQAWLNQLLGPFNFDPTAFFLANEKERRQRLLSAIPFTVAFEEIKGLCPENGTGDLIKRDSVDFSKHGLIVLNDLAKLVYDRRHEVGLDVTRQQKSIEQDKKDMGATPDLKKFVGFDLDRTVRELTDRQRIKTAREKDEAALEDLRRQSTEKGNEIERVEKQLIRLRAEHAEIKQRGLSLKDKLDACVIPDVQSLEAQISEYNQAQKVLNRLEDIERRQGQLEQSSGLYESLDELHKALVNEIPKRLLAKIKLPIDGLEIKGDTIMVKGIALDKLATSEQMRFSISIARSLAGDLKVMCIDRYESLGVEARKAFEAELKGDDFEYFISQVTSGPLTVETTNADYVHDLAERAGRGKVEYGNAGF